MEPFDPGLIHGLLRFMFQVFYKFDRVVGKNLGEDFFDALDCFSASLMDNFRKKKGLTGQLLAGFLCQTKVG